MILEIVIQASLPAYEPFITSTFTLNFVHVKLTAVIVHVQSLFIFYHEPATWYHHSKL